MTQAAARTLYDWWNHMASMQRRYGPPGPDVETAPEWPRLRRLQRRLIREMHEHTGMDPDLLFEALQLAIHHVVGPEPTPITRERAEAIVAEATRAAMRGHAAASQLKGTWN